VPPEATALCANFPATRSSRSRKLSAMKFWLRSAKIFPSGLPRGDFAPSAPIFTVPAGYRWPRRNSCPDGIRAGQVNRRKNLVTL
jgi:hypothetical protein